VPDFPPSSINSLSQIYETPPIPLPQTASKTIFQLQNPASYRGAPAGFIITDIYGIVVVAIGAVANATKLKVIATDAAGTALTAVDLCATLDINALAKGYQLAIDGTLADAMVDNAFGVHVGMAGQINIGFGSTANLQVDCTGSDGGGGMVKWFLVGRPSYGVTVYPTVV